MLPNNTASACKHLMWYLEYFAMHVNVDEEVL